MSNTSPEPEEMMAERYRQMTPEERMEIAVSMCNAARAAIESSLPSELAGSQRRLAFIRRWHGNDLPEAAFQAYANWTDS